MSKQNRPSDPSSATIARPSVAGVEDAWLALTWRFTRGTPRWTSRFHTIFPDALSIAISRHVCSTASSAKRMPPLLLSPVTTVGVPLDATAVVT